MPPLLFGHSGLRGSVDAWVDAAVAFVPRLVIALVVFVVGLGIARLARSVAVDAMTRASGEPRAGQAWGTIVQYALALLVVVASLAVAGVSLAALMLAVGAIGFGLAFAMQDTIANFIAGLILLTTHPFSRGDAVEVGGQKGTVEQVGMRSTQLKSFDGLRVEVPNRSVLGNPLTVFSYYPTRRWDVLAGVGYDDDLPGAVGTVQDALAGLEGVLDDPAPEVFVDELGGSSVNLRVRFWTEKLDRKSMLAIKSEVTRTVKEALDQGGYDIPYPIRTLYLHEVPGGASNGDRESGQTLPP